LNFTIAKGYITGFIGPNGSGKTTTIQMMMDVVKVDAGEIKLFGASHKNVAQKQQIGFVYDDLYMYDEFTIKKMHSFIAPLYTNWNEDLFQHYVQRFQLPWKQKLKKFSKGMKMKCSLLFALSHEPTFIVMDEPTAGLDPIFRRELLGLLQELMVRDGQTIFLSTHITTDLDQIADYIVMIDQGKIIMQKSMEDIRENFFLIKGALDLLDSDIRELFIRVEETEHGFTGLLEGDPSLFKDFEVVVEKVTLEDLMYFMIKRDDSNVTADQT
jgi:ABC-2 type transport system ATP-binding protein